MFWVRTSDEDVHVDDMFDEMVKGFALLYERTNGQNLEVEG